MKQHDRIRQYIDTFGSITPLEAFRDLGITKLATRISEMTRKGYECKKEWETSTNRYGETAKYRRYIRAEN